MWSLYELPQAKKLVRKLHSSKNQSENLHLLSPIRGQSVTANIGVTRR